MKKLLAAIMTIAMLAAVSTTAFAVGELSRVFVTSPKATKQASDTYASGNEIEELPINDVMTELKNLTATKDVVQTIKIESVNGNSKPVNFWLKVELPENEGFKNTDTYSAVDYYSLKVTDNANKVIYDDAEEGISGAEEKVINLGVLNEDKKRSETKEYTIYVSVNKDVNANELSDRPEDVQWKVMYTDNAANFAPTPTPQPTAATGATTAPTNRPSRTNAPTSTPVGTTAPAKRITILCTAKDSGNDVIKPGEYKLVGKGHVVITTSGGAKKAELDLLTDESKSALTKLNEGDTIVLTGDNSAYVQFKAPVKATASPSPKPTATSKPTATPKVTSTPKTTAGPAATSKANPKTGDNAPIVAISVVGVLALGAIAYVALTSKKKKEK